MSVPNVRFATRRLNVVKEGASASQYRHKNKPQIFSLSRTTQVVSVKSKEKYIFEIRDLCLYQEQLTLSVI